MPKLFKYTIALLIIACVFTSSQAQRFRGSLVLGGNFSQITGDSMAGFNKVGLLGGAMVIAPISKKSSFETGILFSQKGSRSKVDTSSSGIPRPFFKLTLNYIEIPLLYQYQYNDYIGLQIGPYVGLLNSAVYNDGNQDFDKTPNFYRFDYGLATGVQIAFTSKIALDIRAVNSVFNYLHYPLFTGLTANTPPTNYYNVVTSFGLRYTLN
mgnify:CR=1 FL=1